MTELRALAIQGIRAFSPDKLEKIFFSPPLTLIVGENGAGKTTVIECLRYCTTGEVPPGVGTGGAWVHDPALSTSTETKAQVRLAFKMITGKTVEIVRNMTVSQKAGARLTFKTLEATLSTRSEGQPQKATLSKKCADLDKEVPELIGVSKAILDHVIFCHQEDSNWPLTESDAKLRDRFDDIFAASRYSKAVEAIKKEKKELVASEKLLKGDLALAQTLRDQAREISAELERDKATVEGHQQKISELKKSIADISAEVEEKRRQLKANAGTFKEIDLLVSQQAEVEKQANQLKDTLKELTETDEELQEAIRDNEAVDKEGQSQVKDLERKVKDLTKKKTDTELRLQTLNQDLGKAQTAQQEVAKAEAQREKLVREALDISKTPVDWTTLDDAKAVEVLEQFKSKVDVAKDRAKQNKENGAQTIKKIDEDITSEKEKLAALNSELKSAQKAIDLNQKDIYRLQKDIESKKELLSKAGEIEGKLKATAEELRQLKASDLTSKQREIKATEERKKELELALKTLQERLRVAQEQKVAHATLEAKRVELHKAEASSSMKAEEKEVQAVLGEEVVNFQTADPQQIQAKLLALQKQKQQHLTTQTAAIGKLKDALSQITGEQKQNTTRLTQLRHSVIGKKKKLGESASKDLPEDIVATEAKLLVHKREVIKNKAIETLYNNFIKTAKEGHSCPLCHQSLPDEAHFEKELQEIIAEVPTKIQEDQSSIESLEKQRSEFQALLPDWQDVKRMLSTEIPPLEAKDLELVGKASALQGQLDSAVAEFVELTAEQTKVGELIKKVEAKKISFDAMLRLQAEIKAEQARLGVESQDVDDAMVEEDLPTQIGDTEEKIGACTEEVALLMAEITNAEKQVHAKELAVKELEGQLLKIHSGDSQSLALQTRITELQTQIEQAKKEAEEKTTEIGEVTEEIEELGEERKKMEASRKATEEKNNTRLSECLRVYTEMSTVYIRLTELRKGAGDLPGILSKIEETKQDIDGVTTTMKESEEEMNIIRSRAQNKSSTRRNLEDNIRYRQELKRLQDMAAKIKGMKASVAGFDQKKLEQEIEAGSKKLTATQSSYSKLTGSKEAIEKTNQDRSTKLRSTNFKDAEEKYRLKLIEHTTTTKAIADLTVYGKALESAVMRYHTLKITEINKVIKELWQATYKGKDIDTIELVAEAVSPENAKARQHNYRVVMVKGSTLLDMRGRCSAGQKVLASLVIRLALAEAFCINCGILALDEPTTNLDRHNVESLAVSLASLIESRKSQKNFQLIVITHDEEFVELLSKQSRCNCDYYYRISKDSNSGLSKIEKKEFHI